MITSSKNNQGQALLVILLIMAVALTVGLSITSRSITDIKISEISEESARAFSAAEAGVEEALLAGEAGALAGEFTTQTDAKVTYETTTSDFGAGNEFVFPSGINRDQVQTLWFAENDASLTKSYDVNSFKVYWGKPGDTGDNAAALEVTVYYQDAGGYKASKYALDSNAVSRGNNFCPLSTPDPNCDSSEVDTFVTGGTAPMGGQTFQYSTRIKFKFYVPGVTKLIFARMRILYRDNQPLGAQGIGDTFPSQGLAITSTGYSGATSRKVQVVKYHPAPPPFFDMVLYSKTNLSK